MIGVAGFLATSRAGEFLAHDADTGQWFTTNDSSVAFLFATEANAVAASNGWRLAEARYERAERQEVSA